MQNYECNIDVDKLTAEVKQSISENGYINNDIPFTEVKDTMLFGSISHSNKLAENIYSLHSQYDVSAYRVLKTKQVLSFMVTPIKKIIRKIISFYIEPMVGQQNEVNRLATSSIADLYFEIESLKKKVMILEEEKKGFKSIKSVEADGDIP